MSKAETETKSRPVSLEGLVEETALKALEFGRAKMDVGADQINSSFQPHPPPYFMQVRRTLLAELVDKESNYFHKDFVRAVKIILQRSGLFNKNLIVEVIEVLNSDHEQNPGTQFHALILHRLSEHNQPGGSDREDGRVRAYTTVLPAPLEEMLKRGAGQFWKAAEAGVVHETALRVIRRNAGYSLNGMARAIGVSPSYLSRAERGKEGPSANIVEKVADKLGVSRFELLGATGFINRLESLNGVDRRFLKKVIDKKRLVISKL